MEIESYALILLFGMVAFLVIYVIVYRIIINKAIAKNNNRHKALTPPDALGKALICIGAFLYVFGLTMNMSSKFETNKTMYLNKIAALEGNIYELKEIIKGETGIATAFDYEISDVDYQNHTVNFEFTVVLREYSADDKVVLTIDEKPVTLKKESINKYVGKLEWNIFENGCFECILTKENKGVYKTEKMDDIDLSYAWQKVLPSAHIVVNERFIYKNSKFIVKGDTVGYLNYTESNFTSGRIVTDKNGNISSEKDITELLVNDMWETKLNISVPVEETDTVKIYVLLEDSAGYTHMVPICGFFEGETMGEWEPESIYDSNGTKLSID